MTLTEALWRRSPAHCIEYAHLIQWDAERPGEAFDADIEEHMRWVFDKAAARAAHYGIQARSTEAGATMSAVPSLPLHCCELSHVIFRKEASSAQPRVSVLHPSFRHLCDRQSIARQLVTP